MHSRMILPLVVLTAYGVCFQAPQSPAIQPMPTSEKRLLKGVQPIAVPDIFKAGYDSITASDALALLSFLASDLLEGRETGSRGYQLAAEYAASLFALWKIQPGGDGEGPGRRYLQRVVMRDFSGLDCAVDWQVQQRDLTHQRTFREGKDFENYYINRIPETRSAPLVFTGYGISEPGLGYDDFEKVDVRGKIVLIIDGTPKTDASAALFHKKEWLEKYGGDFAWLDRIKRGAALDERGPAAVLVARNTLQDGDVYGDREPPGLADERPIVHEPSRLVVLPGARRGNGSIHISRDMADALLSASGESIETLKKRIAASGHPASFEVPDTRLSLMTTAESDSLLRCHNVMGFIQGHDPKLKDEVVIVGAHLDHLGRRGDYVFNGADDNGSGAAAVLQLARAISANPIPPQRTVLFCLWTAEEFNRLGSSHYIAHPSFPLQRTVAYLNLDMIGRPETEPGLSRRARRLQLGPELLPTIKADNFCTVGFSAGRGFGEAIERANRSAGIDLLLQPEMAARTSGLVSDYLSFAQAGIPYVYWAGPLHDEYHQTGDSAEKVSGEWMAKVIRLAYMTIMDLADHRAGPATASQ